MVNQNDASFNNMTGTGGAASYTGRIITMIASFRPNLHFKLRISSISNFNNPVAAITYRNIIFSLAGTTQSLQPTHFLVSTAIAYLMMQPPVSGFSVTNVTKLPLIPVPPIIGSIKTLVISCVSLTPFPKHLFHLFLGMPKTMNI